MGAVVPVHPSARFYVPGVQPACPACLPWDQGPGRRLDTDIYPHFYKNYETQGLLTSRCDSGPGDGSLAGSTFALMELRVQLERQQHTRKSRPRAPIPSAVAQGTWSGAGALPLQQLESAWPGGTGTHGKEEPLTCRRCMVQVPVPYRLFQQRPPGPVLSGESMQRPRVPPRCAWHSREGRWEEGNLSRRLGF